MVSLSLTLNAYSIHLVYLLSFPEVDSELGQTYMMELFAKIVNGWKLLTIFAKSSILFYSTGFWIRFWGLPFSAGEMLTRLRYS